MDSSTTLANRIPGYTVPILRLRSGAAVRIHPSSVILLLWWLSSAYFSIWYSTTSTAASVVAAGVSVETGSIHRQLLISSYGLFGVTHLLLGRGYSGILRRIGFALPLYVCWAALTVLWTQDQSLSTRRLILLLLLLAGSLGLGAGFYGRLSYGWHLLASHLMIMGMFIIAILWTFPILEGNIALFNPDWTLRPVGVGEIPAGAIGFSAIAALYLRRHPSPKPLLLAQPSVVNFYLAISLITLLGLKKRVPLAMTLLVMAVLWFYWLSPLRRRAIVLAVAIAGASLLLVVDSTQSPPAEVAGAYIGRGEDPSVLGTLHGRVPLWNTLLPYVWDRPLHGHGYGAFWTPKTLIEVYRRVGWNAVVAHNGFLDELLSTGFVGLVLFLAWWLKWLRQGVRRARAGTGAVLVGWLALFVLLNLTQSALASPFQEPYLISVVGIGAFSTWEALWE